MVKSYTPQRGDVIRLNFTPQQGHEQAGKRPALVLSPKMYNEKTGLALVCPITHHKKGYPFEVELPENLKTRGVILADHIKNLDWRAREATWIEKAPPETVKKVGHKVSLLVEVL